jgi:hypothetical protein
LRSQVEELKGLVERQDSKMMLSILSGSISKLMADVKDLKTKSDNQTLDQDHYVYDEENPPTDSPPTFMLDSHSEHTAGLKKTIEYQPGTGDHRNEIQLYDSDDVWWPDAYRIPVLPKDSGGIGNLTWEMFDSDKLDPATTQRSLARNSGMWEIFDFANPTPIEITAAGDRTDRTILIRDASASPVDIKYANLSTLKVADSDHADEADHLDPGGFIDIVHDDLDGTPGDSQGSLGDAWGHDWHHWVQGGTYASCYGQSIGYGTATIAGSGSGVERIDLQTGKISKSDGAGSATSPAEGWFVDGKPFWAITDATHYAKLLDTGGSGDFANDDAVATLCSSTKAGYFADAYHAVDLCNGTDAGYFTNAGNSLIAILCGPVYAFDATAGGINANATDGFYCGGTPGLGAGTPVTRTWEDVNNQIHTVTIAGGIITDWVVS